MVMLMPGLAKREDRLPFSIGPRAQIVTSTVLGAPVTFVERTSADAIEDDPDEEAEELLQGLKNLLTNSGGA